MENYNPNDPRFDKKEDRRPELFKCQQCSNEFPEGTLEKHIPSGLTLCEDCLEYCCKVQAEEDGEDLSDWPTKGGENLKVPKCLEE